MAPPRHVLRADVSRENELKGGEVLEIVSNRKKSVP
jgi:hypothetical protein